MNKISITQYSQENPERTSEILQEVILKERMGYWFFQEMNPERQWKKV